MHLSSKLENKTISDDEKKDLGLLSTVARDLERKVSLKRRLVPPEEFAFALSQAIQLKGEGLVKSKVIKATFQIDSVIAKQALDGESDFILSEDSDFAAIVFLIQNLLQ